MLGEEGQSLVPVKGACLLEISHRSDNGPTGETEAEMMAASAMLGGATHCDLACLVLHLPQYSI